jgi:hypothetical protein
MNIYVIIVLETGESWDLRLETQTRRRFALCLFISIPDQLIDLGLLLRRQIS